MVCVVPVVSALLQRFCVLESALLLKAKEGGRVVGVRWAGWGLHRALSVSS